MGGGDERIERVKVIVQAQLVMQMIDLSIKTIDLEVFPQSDDVAGRMSNPIDGDCFLISSASILVKPLDAGEA